MSLARHSLLGSELRKKARVYGERSLMLGSIWFYHRSPSPTAVSSLWHIASWVVEVERLLHKQYGKVTDNTNRLPAQWYKSYILRYRKTFTSTWQTNHAKHNIKFGSALYNKILFYIGKEDKKMLRFSYWNSEKLYLIENNIRDIVYQIKIIRSNDWSSFVPICTIIYIFRTTAYYNAQ
jgi:hypothetical protein